MDNIKPRSHDPDDLVRLASSAVLQERRYFDLRTRLRTEFVSLYEFRYLHTLPELLQRGFIILDNYFFLHALRDNGVQLSLQSHIAPDSVLRHGAAGMYYHSDSRICVCTRFARGQRHRSIEQMLCTLVHEMAHAYLHVFSIPAQYLLKVDTVANRGHGLPWNVVFHTLVNRICQWSPTFSNFGSVADRLGRCDFVQAADRLEYPKDDDPVSDDEPDDKRQAAGAHRLGKKTFKLSTRESLVVCVSLLMAVASLGSIYRYG